MRLIRKNNVFVFDGFGDGDFIDTPDVQFKIDVVQGCSLLDSIKIYWQKRRLAPKNTHISINLWRFLKSKKRFIEFIKLDNADKYLTNNVKSVCPIEKIIAKFCCKFNKKIDHWMFVVRQDEYRIRIVSGVKDVVINSRTVKIRSDNDLEKELIKTHKFINRNIEFNGICVITNTNLKENELYNIFKFDDCINSYSDVWEMLLRFASENDVYESTFGMKKKRPKKCNIFSVILFMLASCYCTYTSYVSMKRCEYDYLCATKNARTLQSTIINIFFNKENLNKVSKVYDAISKIKSPLYDLRKLFSSGIGTNSGALKRVRWQKNNIVIDGDNIGEETINSINGKIIVDSNGYQRIEIKL